MQKGWSCPKFLEAEVAFVPLQSNFVCLWVTAVYVLAVHDQSCNARMTACL